MKSNYCKHNIVPFATPCTAPYTVSFTNGLLTAVAFLGVVVLLLITCVALLVAVLAVTANKLNKLRAQKAHTDPHHYTDPPHYNNQTDPPHCHTEPGGGEGKAKERVYDEVGKRAAPTEGQSGQYQELELGTMERRQYESLGKKSTSVTLKGQ